MERVCQRVGSRIRGLRKEAGFTLDSLAEKISLSSGKYLGQIERGEINCTIITLEKITKGLGLKIENLFPQDEDETISEIVEHLRNKDATEKKRMLRVVKALSDEAEKE